MCSTGLILMEISDQTLLERLISLARLLDLFIPKVLSSTTTLSSIQAQLLQVSTSKDCHFSASLLMFG